MCFSEIKVLLCCRIEQKNICCLTGFQFAVQHSYHALCISEIKSAQEENAAKIINESDEKYKKLNKLYMEITKSLSAERNEVLTLKEIVKQKDTQISAKEKENALLQKKLQETLNNISNNNKKISILEEKTHELNILLEEVKSLKDRCEKAEIALVEAKKHELTPQMVREMSKDVIEDLRSQGLSEENFLADADKIFSDDETIDVSWDKLSANEIEKILYVLERMNTNEIGSNDIESLDLVENMVLYKYMIVKSLKTVFYKYLEQKSREKTIYQSF